MTHNFGFCLLSLFLIGCGANDDAIKEDIKKDSSIIPPSVTEYGFVLDSFQVKRDTVKGNWTMSHMFAPYGISQLDINVAAEKAADSLVGLRYVKEGTPFIILSALGDTSENAEFVIYPQNLVNFVFQAFQGLYVVFVVMMIWWNLLKNCFFDHFSTKFVPKSNVLVGSGLKGTK